MADRRILYKIISIHHPYPTNPPEFTAPPGRLERKHASIPLEMSLTNTAIRSHQAIASQSVKPIHFSYLAGQCSLITIMEGEEEDRGHLNLLVWLVWSTEDGRIVTRLWIPGKKMVIRCCGTAKGMREEDGWSGAERNDAWIYMYICMECVDISPVSLSCPCQVQSKPSRSLFSNGEFLDDGTAAGSLGGYVGGLIRPSDTPIPHIHPSSLPNKHGAFPYFHAGRVAESKAELDLVRRSGGISQISSNGWVHPRASPIPRSSLWEHTS